jgi:hypothetical protein
LDPTPTTECPIDLVGSVHPDRPLDGLDHVVDQVSEEFNAVDGLALGGDRVVERQLVGLQAELSGPLVGPVYVLADLDHRLDHRRRVDEAVVVASQRLLQ